MNKYILLFIISFYSVLLTGQDTIVPKNNDSLLNVGEDIKKRLDKEITQENLDDSLAVIALKLQSENLRFKDSLKKKALQKRVDSLENAQKERDIIAKKRYDSLRSTNNGVPVVLENDTLFFLFAKLGPYSPTDRARGTISKLQKLAQSETFKKDSLAVFKGESSYDLMYKDIILLSVSDKDAFWNNVTRAELIEHIKSKIGESVTKLQESNSIWYAIKRVIFLILIILGFYFAIKYMNKGFTALNVVLVKKSSQFFKGFKVKNYELLSPERQELVIKYSLKSFKWVLIVLIVYLCLPLALSIFPSTEPIASTLIEYILSPLKMFGIGILRFIPNVFSIAVIVIITRFVIRFLNFIATEVNTGRLVLNGFYPEWSKPTLNIFKIIVYAMAFIMIFPYLPGSDSDVFKGVSVFLGILISLGSSTAIGNLVAGLVITYMRAFKIGDKVKIGETTGVVLEKNLLVTRLRTSKNEEVTIPNASILNGSTINYTSQAEDIGVVLHKTVTIGYDVSWREVHELLIKAAASIEHVDQEKNPFVLQTSLDDFYVSYQINLYTKYPNNSPKIESDLNANIQDLFKEANIEIMSPHYRANREGDSTIPK